jgi:hypothetical protein
MAVTTNQLIERSDGVLESAPIAASTTLYQGTLAFITAAGYLDDDTATGTNGFFGIVIRQYDNSAGAAGAVVGECYREGVFMLTGSGFSQANVGDRVYAEDNYTIGTSVSTASVYIGKIVRYISSTKVAVEIETTAPAILAVAALTTITHTSPGTADYAMQNMTNSSPYGFVTQDEANTLLSVIKNLQQRVALLEAQS